MVLTRVILPSFAASIACALVFLLPCPIEIMFG